MAAPTLLYVTQVAPYRDGPAGVHGVLDQSSTAMAELAGLAGLGFQRVNDVATLDAGALAALDRGATLAVAGIHLTDVPALSYERHLFEERSLTSVTANTRADGEELLRVAARVRPRVATQPYPLEHADEALADLARDRINGVAVLRVA
ncbi:MAG TPA: hypothetical protein VF005_06310 [Acidimicrobiales bacterium]